MQQTCCVVERDSKAIQGWHAPAGAGFGYLAYKRPRLAMIAGGLVAFTTLPYAAAMVYTVNRWGTLLGELPTACLMHHESMLGIRQHVRLPQVHPK